MGYWIKKSLLGKEAMIVMVIVSFVLIYAGFRLDKGYLSKIGLFLFLADVLSSAVQKS